MRAICFSIFINGSLPHQISSFSPQILAAGVVYDSSKCAAVSAEPHVRYADRPGQAEAEAAAAQPTAQRRPVGPRTDLVGVWAPWHHRVNGSPSRQTAVFMRVGL